MKLNAYKNTDVLVMGAGLAGIMAAITAAEAGASVCLTSSSNICSGSSFYPGTWGLGLIGPESKEDEKDLQDTILRIGENMADSQLVHAFVSGIEEGIETLENMGVKLKKARQKSEREFIPCFDYKNRAWNGVTQDSAKEVFKKRLKELNVICLPHTEIISIVSNKENGNRVCGAVALTKDGVKLLACKTMIIASGGMGGLFRYRLNTDDIQAMGQYLALDAGASLVNIEFMQMMPGFVSPAPKTIYNEKVFRYSEFLDSETGENLFSGMPKDEVENLLNLRSGHGPYTSRLKSGKIDEILFSQFVKDQHGITLRYKESIWENQPEFVRTYFEWLEQEKHLTIRDTVKLGIFAHASNGGIRIDSQGDTGVPGLYACGEVTGGMHGADRMGGLSTANGLVFGRRAGAAAAADSKNGSGSLEEVKVELGIVEAAPDYLEEIRRMNFNTAMINRSESSAEAGLALLKDVEARMVREIHPVLNWEEASFSAIRYTYRLKAAVKLSQCLLNAIKMRKESRGPHHRVDYPKLCPEMNRRILCSGGQDIRVTFER